MQESRVIFDRYTARLRPVDTMYERIFKLFKMHGHLLSGIAEAATGKVQSSSEGIKKNLDETLQNRFVLPVKGIEKS
jgi:hypothetical protein